MLTLGTLTLDNDPYVAINYNYNQTSNGTVIGGQKNITLTGSIASNTSEQLIAEANAIKDWFADSSNRFLQSVTINNQSYSSLRVDSVSVDSDNWVSQLNYTINLIAEIESTAVLPTSILSLSYNDYVDNLDITESLQLSADSRGTAYLANGTLQTIGQTVKWDIKLSIKCHRTATASAASNAKALLESIIITTPDRSEFLPYKNWNLYLQSRNISSNASEGSLDFSCQAVLLPTQITNPALINIKPSENHNYTSNSHTKTISCSVNGLAEIPWSSIITLTDTCFLTNRMANAQTAIDSLKTIYRNISNFPGRGISAAINTTCGNYCDTATEDSEICYSPRTLTVNRSNNGSASVDMEWGADGSNCTNGLTIEVEETLNNVDQTIAENSNYWIAAPIITNLNCNKARKLSYIISVNSRYKCPQASLYNAAWAEYNTIIDGLSIDWFLIKKSSSETNNSYTINLEFVEGC